MLKKNHLCSLLVLLVSCTIPLTIFGKPAHEFQRLPNEPKSLYKTSSKTKLQSQRIVHQFKSECQRKKINIFTNISAQIAISNIHIAVENNAKFNFQEQFANYNNSSKKSSNFHLVSLKNKNCETILVGVNLVTAMKVKINELGQKWANLQFGSVQALNFNKVDPTSVSYEVCATGEINNASIALNRKYSLRTDPNNIISENMGFFNVYNTNKSINNFLDTSVGAAVLIISTAIASAIVVSTLLWGGACVSRYFYKRFFSDWMASDSEFAGLAGNLSTQTAKSCSITGQEIEASRIGIDETDFESPKKRKITIRSQEKAVIQKDKIISLEARVVQLKSTLTNFEKEETDLAYASNKLNLNIEAKQEELERETEHNFEKQNKELKEEKQSTLSSAKNSYWKKLGKLNKEKQLINERCDVLTKDMEYYKTNKEVSKNLIETEKLNAVTLRLAKQSSLIDADHSYAHVQGLERDISIKQSVIAKNKQLESLYFATKEKKVKEVWALLNASEEDGGAIEDVELQVYELEAENIKLKGKILSGALEGDPNLYSFSYNLYYENLKSESGVSFFDYFSNKQKSMWRKTGGKITKFMQKNVDNPELLGVFRRCELEYKELYWTFRTTDKFTVDDICTFIQKEKPEGASWLWCQEQINLF